MAVTKHMGRNWKGLMFSVTTDLCMFTVFTRITETHTTAKANSRGETCVVLAHITSPNSNFNMWICRNCSIDISNEVIDDSVSVQAGNTGVALYRCDMTTGGTGDTSLWVSVSYLLQTNLTEVVSTL